MWFNLWMQGLPGIGRSQWRWEGDGGADGWGMRAEGTNSQSFLKIILSYMSTRR